MSLPIGQPVPWFTATTPSNPQFVFDTAAGRYVLMVFPPADPQGLGATLRALVKHQAMLDEVKAIAFVILRDLAMVRGARDMLGLRWMSDHTGAITRTYGPEPHWLLLDPTLRVLAVEPIDQAEAMFARIAGLPEPAAHAGVPLHAPVLVAPNIFEPELCEALIDLHRASGGKFTGVMRDQGARTVAVMDELKKRRDVLVEAPELQAAIRERLSRRLFPFVRMALGFTVTHTERLLVSCYDAEDGGVFHAHRDNTTQGTAYRRFACSLNLNADFEGGDLKFAEFGQATYRPPPGGAVVFSCGLMHEATKITAGRRYAFLPFFYDDAGAETLAAYNARVAQAQAAAPS